jgi:catechol 2,3-dioxygenase-like lactoylglutathione lyase family enzyme
MAIKLNHTIVFVKDKAKSANFLSELLGLPPPAPFGPFLTVQMANDVTLDFMDSDEPVRAQHYAFLIEEKEFDEIFARIQKLEIRYWADPYRRYPNEINSWGGGRGVYFEDPSGHFLEIMTRPYS